MNADRRTLPSLDPSLSSSLALHSVFGSPFAASKQVCAGPCRRKKRDTDLRPSLAHLASDSSAIPISSYPIELIYQIGIYCVCSCYLHGCETGVVEEGFLNLRWADCEKAPVHQHTHAWPSPSGPNVCGASDGLRPLPVAPHEHRRPGKRWTSCARGNSDWRIARSPCC